MYKGKHDYKEESLGTGFYDYLGNLIDVRNYVITRLNLTY